MRKAQSRAEARTGKPCEVASGRDDGGWAVRRGLALGVGSRDPAEVAIERPARNENCPGAIEGVDLRLEVIDQSLQGGRDGDTTAIGEQCLIARTQRESARAGRALDPLIACLALRAGRALGPLIACLALWAGRALDPLIACLALWAGRALGPLIACLALWAGRALDPLIA